MVGPDSCKDHDERTVHINLSSTARPVPVGRFLKSGPSLSLYYWHREQAVVGAGKELRVQKRGKGRVPCLGIETEQALGLRRREPEAGHLKVFRADSAQQFFRCHVHTRARNKMALPFAMNLPWDALGENPFHTNDHARGGEESGLTDPPPLQ